MASVPGIQTHKLHHLWLERVEKKIFDTFESLKYVYLEVLEGSSLITGLDGPSFCCKKNNELIEEKRSSFCERSDKKYKLELEFWKQECLKLKNKYELARKEISNVPERSSINPLNGPAKILQRKRAQVANVNDEGGTEVVVINSHEDYQEKDLVARKDELENKLKSDDERTVSIDEKLIDMTKDENSERIELEDCRELNRVEEEPSWKRAYRELKSKQSTKVKYQEFNKSQPNTSIDDFFKPKQVVSIRGIRSKRSKRQLSEEMSLKLSKKMKTKDGEAGTLSSSSGHGGVSTKDMPSGKSASCEEDDGDQCREAAAFEADVCKEVKDKDDGASYNGSSVSSRIGKSHKSLRIVFDTGDIDTDTTASLLVETNKKEKRPGITGEKSRSVASEDEATRWDVEENVGLPSLASTPMLTDKNKVWQNGNDFDETMWSAPQSPSVVPPVFATPEKSNYNVQSRNRQEQQQMGTPFGTFAGKTPLPINMPDSNLHTTEVSCDSRRATKRYDLTCKTSDADLSCDMFHASPQESDSGSERDHECKEEISYHDGELEDRKSAEAQKSGNGMEDRDYVGRYHEPKRPDINYKYNIVVRKKDERDKMDGFECRECAAWYQDEQNNEEKKKHLKLVCRHKAVSSPPPATPEGFWSLEFPPTQVYMDKGHMYNENDPLPEHAIPRVSRNRLRRQRMRAQGKTDQL